MFVSTSIFMSLSSAEFCAKYLYGWFPVSDPSRPLLSLSSFMLAWSTFQLVVTIYILLFVPETPGHPEEKKIKQEAKPSKQANKQAKNTKNGAKKGGKNGALIVSKQSDSSDDESEV